MSRVVACTSLIVAALVGVAAGKGGDAVMSRILSVSRLQPGKPFRADYEAVRLVAGTRDVERGKLYVDSLRRVREEFTLEGAVAAIWDPVRKLSVLVDRASGRVLVRTPILDDAATAGPRSPSVAPTRPQSADWPPGGSASEDLGEKDIEGLACRGFRTGSATAGGAVTETWFSEELGLVVLDRLSSETEEVERRVFNIQRGEPDPALFAIPD
jgi:hypothetical protein